MTMALLLSLVKYVDIDEVEHWVEVTPDVAQVLAEVEPPLKERLLRDPDGMNAVMGRSNGYAWDGPRYVFRWLLGESLVWHGDSWFEVDGQKYCRFCLGAKLPYYAYCLGCDQCGRDDTIGRPSTQDLARQNRGPKRDGLNGGRS